MLHTILDLISSTISFFKLRIWFFVCLKYHTAMYFKADAEVILIFYYFVFAICMTNVYDSIVYGVNRGWLKRYCVVPLKERKWSHIFFATNGAMIKNFTHVCLTTREKVTRINARVIFTSFRHVTVIINLTFSSNTVWISISLSSWKSIANNSLHLKSLACLLIKLQWKLSLQRLGNDVWFSYLTK